MDRPVFVPFGDNRKETAVVLVGTAREFGIHQRAVLAAAGGFWITEELAAHVFEDQASDAPKPEPEPKPEPKATPKAEEQDKPAPKKTASKKTSGNRAAKNSTPDKE